MCHQMDVLPQVLSGGGNVGHVFVQNVLLGADTVILDVLWPVQLANIKVEGLKDDEDEFSTVSSTDSQYARVIGSAGCVCVCMWPYLPVVGAQLTHQHVHVF